MTHAEIIAKLQNAKGPDRGLDCRIAYILGYEPEGLSVSFQEYCNLHSFAWHEIAKDADKYQNVLSRTLPRFTASLDAIVALVERERRGWVWEIYSDCSARIWEDVVRRYPPDFPATAATPAIALCIALMKSMEK